MASAIQIGTARSKPGEITYGAFEAVPQPTGGADFFPVIIAQGHTAKGPVLWLTGNIHGPEYDGLAVIHQLITPDLLSNLSGTVVAIPTLNPAGLRTGERSPYYLPGKDPNRLFPGITIPFDSADSQYPSALELAYARLFERIDATADYLIDLHNFGALSIPFVFRDPVFYREQRDKPVAQKLQNTVGEMVNALGLTVINDFVSDQYLKVSLHRSVSGAALNRGRVPAVTIELGGQRVVNIASVRAALSGIRNMMRWAGMLPGPLEPITGVPIIKTSYPVRRTTHPRVPEACLAHPLVQPGDWLKAGDPVARLVDIYGRPLGVPDGLLRTEYDGFVIGLFPGMAFYANDAILSLAVRDDTDSVIQIPAAR